MLPNILRKLLSLLLTLFVLATITFFLMHSVPGGPFDSERALPAAVKANMATSFGLDLPVWKQYTKYIFGMLHGDFGPSYKYIGRDVREMICESLPISLLLGVLALGWALLFGLGLGVMSAYKRKSMLSAFTSFFSVSSLSLPSYLLAAALVYIFCVRLDILPPAQWESWRSMILPVITLGMRPAAMVARLIRASLLESLQADYVRTARAKGLSEAVILWKHCLRNSFLPVLSLLGLLVANIITGSFVVEYIFAIPGMGKYFIDAVTSRDYPLIMGVTMVYGFALVASNLLVDLAYAWLDPRIRIV